MITIKNLLCFMLLALLGMMNINEVRAAGTLNEKNYKKLQAIHQLIEKNKIIEAQQKLETFLSLKHNAYTQAIFLQTAAHAALEREQYNKAIRYLEKAEAFNALPEFVSLNIQYNLAQLYAQKGAIDKSLNVLERWLAGSKNITSEQHIFVATLYARKKKYQAAIKHVKQAISLSEKKAEKIKQHKKSLESWYQLLISLYLEQKKYQQAIKVVQKVIKKYPANKNYWKQLSGLYLQTNKPQRALAVLELAEKQGLLTTQEETLRLVNLYLYVNIPFRAAQLLQDKIAAGRVKKSIEISLKLVDSWIMAQEYPKAIMELKQLALLDKKNGQHQFRLGRLLMEQGKWLAAFKQFEAVQYKKIKEPGKNFLLQGICAYYAKLPEKAKIAFEKAGKFKKYQEKAQVWQEQLEQ